MQHPTRHHTEYAPPVIRAASPASSIGTTYGEDETSFSDTEEQLSQEAFERKWEERLGLGLARPEEEMANEDPLIPRPPEGSDEETKLHERVVISLRAAVRNLEENELFEQTLLRGSLVAQEPLPTTTDIDALMRSMMVVSESATSSLSDGNAAPAGHQTHFGVRPQVLVPGKRSRNGTRRN